MAKTTARREGEIRPRKNDGWKGDEEVGARKMHAFFELHIEQGPILEAEGKDIGVVTHGQGLWWLVLLDCTLHGHPWHAHPRRGLPAAPIACTRARACRSCPCPWTACTPQRVVVVLEQGALRGAQLSFRKFCGANRAIFGFWEILMDFGGFCRIWDDLGGFGRIWTLEGPWDAPRGSLGRP